MGGPFRGIRAIGLAAVLAVAVAGCGGSAPASPPCGVTDTAADEATFAKHFTAMALVDEATGQPGPEDLDYGATFSTSQRVAIDATTKGAVAVRVCVRERTREAKVMSDTDVSMPSGEARVPLGTFPSAGPYVVSVIVDGVIARNLQLLIR